MSAFATLEDTAAPVRVVLVGAGLMGRKWLQTILASPDAELAGLVDLDLGAAREALDSAGMGGLPTGRSVSELARTVGAHAVINVTVPQAHHPVTVEALFAGLPVLSEKPLAPTVAEGLSLAGAAEASEQLLMVSQSRRYYRSLAAFREQVRALGGVGVATTEFFKAPHFGGFREEMDHVLLVDMAIHAFDAARYLLDQDPVAVYCEEFNPSWSWYRGSASASAIFELSEGTRYVYTGSWCSDGLQTSWNGRWRVSGASGTATWDGESDPEAELTGSGGVLPGAVAAPETPEEIAGSLAEFIHALRSGESPSGEVHSNVLSLAMVEAAVRSAESGRRVRIADVLDAAHEAALAGERIPAVRSRLELGRLRDAGAAAGDQEAATPRGKG